MIRGAKGDPHRYHLFTTVFTNGCGLSGWTTNSIIVHSVADSASGPFTFHDTALPIYHTNPQVVQHTDGTYLLFAAGAINASLELPCRDGAPVRAGPAGPWTKTAMYTSKSLYGPWKLHKPAQPQPFAVLPGINAVSDVASTPRGNESTIVYLGIAESAGACRDRVKSLLRNGEVTATSWSWFDGTAGTGSYRNQCYARNDSVWAPEPQAGCFSGVTSEWKDEDLWVLHATNPSPFVLRNGTVLVMTTGSLPVFAAPHWSAPFKMLGAPPIAARVPSHCAQSNATAANATDWQKPCAIEDPMLYLHEGQRGQQWIVLLHQWVAGASSVPPNGGVGGIAYGPTAPRGAPAPSLFGEWAYDYWRPAYTTTVDYVDGSEEVLGQRERPKLFVDSDGEIWLINGVSPPRGDRHCYTMAQRVVGGILKSDDHDLKLNQSQLFLDGSLLQTSQGLSIRMHRPVVDPDPVIT